MRNLGGRDHLGGVSECEKNVLKPNLQELTVRVWADSFFLG